MQSHKKVDKLVKLEADKRCKRKVIETIHTAQISDFEEEEELQKAVDMLEAAHYEPIDNEGLHFLAKTIRQTMLEIAELKERNQERRHQELMQFLEKHFSNAKETISEDDEPGLEAAHKTHSEVQSSFEAPLEIELQTKAETIEVNNSLGQELALEEIRLKLLPRTSIVEERNDFQQMRRNMLALQRKKMEDRERKKRNVL